MGRCLHRLAGLSKEFTLPPPTDANYRSLVACLEGKGWRREMTLPFFSRSCTDALGDKDKEDSLSAQRGGRRLTVITTRCFCRHAEGTYLILPIVHDKLRERREFFSSCTPTIATTRLARARKGSTAGVCRSKAG